MRTPMPIDRARLRAFCSRWQVEEVALFGSVLRDDFRPDSDVDVLVRFAPGAVRILFDYVRMGDELSELFGRTVHLVDRRALDASPNRVLQRAVLDGARTVVAGGGEVGRTATTHGSWTCASPPRARSASSRA